MQALLPLQQLIKERDVLADFLTHLLELLLTVLHVLRLVLEILLSEFADSQLDAHPLTRLLQLALSDLDGLLQRLKAHEAHTAMRLLHDRRHLLLLRVE